MSREDQTEGQLRIRTIVQILNALDKGSLTKFQVTWGTIPEPLTCAVFGGKNSKENIGFRDLWASESLSLICILIVSFR